MRRRESSPDRKSTNSNVFIEGDEMVDFSSFFFFFGDSRLIVKDERVRASHGTRLSLYRVEIDELLYWLINFT